MASIDYGHDAIENHNHFNSSRLLRPWGPSEARRKWEKAQVENSKLDLHWRCNHFAQFNEVTKRTLLQ